MEPEIDIQYNDNFIKPAMLRRESSLLIKKQVLDKLYKNMHKRFNNETNEIKEIIINKMLENNATQKNNSKNNKIAIFVGNQYNVMDYVDVFETCYNDVLDIPLLDQLNEQFPYFKVYSKIVKEVDESLEIVRYYVIYIKWSKKQTTNFIK